MCKSYSREGTESLVTSPQRFWRHIENLKQGKKCPHRGRLNYPVICYRPPSQNEATQKIADLLRGLHATGHPFLLTGDLNLPELTWEDGEPTYRSRTARAELFIDALTTCEAEQSVTAPTRGGNFLDLVVTRGGAAHSRVRDKIFDADHEAVETRFTVDLGVPPRVTRTKVYKVQNGRLLCVPEHILGVSLDDGVDLERTVLRAVRRLQLRHHPDRPGGNAFLSRLVNISATWLIEHHRSAYRAWAASESGAIQIARATLAAPQPLRLPLTSCDEQAIASGLDASIGRSARLRLENGRIAEDLRRVRAEREESRRQWAEAAAQLAVLKKSKVAADREAAALRSQLASLQAQRRRELQVARARAATRVVSAHREASACRRRLAESSRRWRHERRAVNAVVGAVQTAEMAAAGTAERLRAQLSQARPRLLEEHLRRTMEGRMDSDSRRTARRLLKLLF
ncbi:hypothetical protein FJT64_002414 [Amphibalanus amphitrite]|uniref:Endonuclease/exonuclease/phosphatase domain-containing protein n=1 Tax=Amphibalanus amphitrite TaxID=1232801 RepID=A0A6A4WGK5_AMPAM|nr:hypothetical protein FJT64_002414 [Amphibalanus amphitrite]